MEQEQKQNSPLFRQKSLERISSPEQLHDYMRVTSPRLWMILGAIVALLVGFVVYASTTRMESTVTMKMEAFDYGVIRGTIPDSYRDVITENMAVRIGGKTGTINHISTTSGYLLNVALDGGELQDGYYNLTLDGKQPVYGENTLWLTCSNRHFIADKTREESALIEQLRSSGDVRVRIWSTDSIKIVYEGRLPATVRLTEPKVRTLIAVTMDDSAEIAPGRYHAEITVPGTDEPQELEVTVYRYGDFLAVLPEGNPGAALTGAAIRIDGQTGKIDRVTSDTGYELEIVSDSTVLADGEYRVTLAGADPSAEETPFMLVTASNGRIIGGLSESDDEIMEKLRSGETSVCFWNEPGVVDYQGGRLATVTGVMDYVSTAVNVVLDDPNAVLESGMYDAEIVTESTTPISFLLN